MQETANKQKRITLKTVHEMLDGISVELAEKVHLLFMANYIDYSDYDFGDENLVESYCWRYRDFFELTTKESQEIVNSQLIEFLDEWRQDAPSRYRKAKDDICYWITDEWYSFESPMQKEIESAYQTALKKKDDMAIALALSPFARKTAELVNSGAYEAAAGNCYTIFRCLAKTCKEHEDWFLRPDGSWTSQAAEPSGKRHPCGDADRRGFTGYGDTYTKLAIFTEAVVELYCHLRQKADFSKRMADEMDINLEVWALIRKTTKIKKRQYKTDEKIVKSVEDNEIENYEKAMRFLSENHRKPSRYVAEERDLRNWWKATKKRMNAGELKPERVDLFEKLLALADENKHVNQYV